MARTPNKVSVDPAVLEEVFSQAGTGTAVISLLSREDDFSFDAEIRVPGGTPVYGVLRIVAVSTNLTDVTAGTTIWGNLRKAIPSAEELKMKLAWSKAVDGIPAEGMPVHEFKAGVIASGAPAEDVNEMFSRGLEDGSLYVRKGTLYRETE